MLEVFEQWAAALNGASCAKFGLAFLRLWLRRGTLEPFFYANWPDFLNGGWRKMEVQGCGHFHWE